VTATVPLLHPGTMTAWVSHRSSLAATWCACVSAGCLSNASPAPSARAAPPLVYRVDWLEEIGDAPLLVGPVHCRRVPLTDDTEEGARSISAEAAHGGDVVMSDSSCRLPRARLLVLETSLVLDDEVEICEVHAVELREDEACEGSIAVDDPRASISLPPELEWERDGRPIQGEHTLAFEELVLHEHRGPPIDEICPNSATLDVTRTDGSVVGRWEGFGIFDVHAIITLGPHRWLMIDDRLVPLDGGEPGRVGGGRFIDWGADPCL
jgi:hypothetical protein